VEKYSNFDNIKFKYIFISLGIGRGEHYCYFASKLLGNHGFSVIDHVNPVRGSRFYCVAYYFRDEITEIPLSVTDFS